MRAIFILFWLLTGCVASGREYIPDGEGHAIDRQVEVTAIAEAEGLVSREGNVLTVHYNGAAFARLSDNSNRNCRREWSCFAWTYLSKWDLADVDGNARPYTVVAFRPASGVYFGIIDYNQRLVGFNGDIMPVYNGRYIVDSSLNASHIADMLRIIEWGTPENNKMFLSSIACTHAITVSGDYELSEVNAFSVMCRNDSILPDGLSLAQVRLTDGKWVLTEIAGMNDRTRQSFPVPGHLLREEVLKAGVYHSGWPWTIEDVASSIEWVQP